MHLTFTGHASCWKCDREENTGREFLPSGCLYCSGLLCDTVAHTEKRCEGKRLSGGTGVRRFRWRPHSRTSNHLAHWSGGGGRPPEDFQSHGRRGLITEVDSKNISLAGEGQKWDDSKEGRAVSRRQMPLSKSRGEQARSRETQGPGAEGVWLSQPTLQMSPCLQLCSIPSLGDGPS